MRSEHFLAGMMICVNLEFRGFCCRLFKVPGLFEPTVTVIMLSPGVTGASRHLGFASEYDLTPPTKFTVGVKALASKKSFANDSCTVKKTGLRIRIQLTFRILIRQ